jgi:GST-like protein
VIELYYYTSPNSRKVLIALEELELPYRICWVDLASGEQHDPAFRHVSPGGKVPAIVDREAEGAPLALFESAAILTYLADRTGRLLPTSGPDRYRTLAWLSWQIGFQGPMLGQATHFHSYTRASGIDAPYALERYVGEAKKCYEVMNVHLSEHAWFGPEFSIADIALFPWTRTAKGQGIDLSAYPAVAEWSQRISARPSARVKPTEDATRGQKAGRDYSDGKSQKNLFGDAFAGRAKDGA